MPTPALTDEQCREAYDAWVRHYKSHERAAEEIGIPRNTFQHRLKVAKSRGFGVDPAIKESMAAVGTGLVPALAWAKTRNPDGTSYSVLLKPQQEDGEIQAEKIRNILADLPPAPPIIQSEKSAAGKVAFFPHSDVHIGVDIDADRGGRDYTPEIAVERMKDGFAQCHAAIPPCETAIVLNNGDLTHANDDRDVTFKSQHRLKVKGSHRSNLRLATMATAWQIDMALTRSERVIYRPNRGNHDPNTPDTLTIALSLYYADNPRVTIDTSEREIWIYQRGLLFLSAWHGDKRKAEDVCKDIPPNFPAEYGASRFWYGYTGHFHGPKQGVHAGIHWWQLPSVCSMDQHSADANYTDDAAMRAMMFCERGGLKNDITVRF